MGARIWGFGVYRWYPTGVVYVAVIRVHVFLGIWCLFLVACGPSGGASATPQTPSTQTSPAGAASTLSAPQTDAADEMNDVDPGQPPQPPSPSQSGTTDRIPPAPPDVAAPENSEAECRDLLTHIVSLANRAHLQTVPHEQAPTPAQLQAIVDSLAGEFLPRCYKLERAVFVCERAAENRDQLIACTNPPSTARP